MIRTFQNDDLDTIMKLWLETNRNAHDFIDEGYWLRNYDTVKGLLPSSTIFIYEDNNMLQGFIGLMDHYIAGIFVNAACQSKGVGKALLDHAKEKHSQLSLHVYKRNVRAVRFYLREGFTVLKEQIDENTGEVELEMNWMK